MGSSECAVGISRRALLVGAVGTAAFAVPFAGSSVAAFGVENDGRTDDTVQYGFLVRPRDCVNCRKCVEACRRANGTEPDEPSRRVVTSYENRYGQKWHVSTSCMQCAQPACMQVCPAGAISKGEGGIVTVDKDRCIGCKFCFQACPFGVPKYTGSGMDKCDACLGAGVALGDEPNCAQACIFGGLEYGPIDKLLAKAGPNARLVDSSVEPSLVLA